MIKDLKKIYIYVMVQDKFVDVNSKCILVTK